MGQHTVPEASPSLKPRIVELLRLISSEDRQLAYERDVPYVDITAELICMWFDDLYHPNDPLVKSSFSADEIEALAQFHTFFDQAQLQLPESQGMVRTWLADPVWRDIMKKAQETVARIAT